MINRFERFICDIAEIDLYWHRIASSVMKRYGLKGSYSIYLTTLSEESDGLSAAELAMRCGRDKADVSRDLSALEKAGLTKRILNGASSYRAKIVLTEKGTEFTRIVEEKVNQAVEHVGQSYSEEERSCFYKVLTEIKTGLKELSETGLSEERM